MATQHDAPTRTRQPLERTRRARPAQVLGVRATTSALVALLAVLAVVTTLVAVRWQPLMSLDHQVARWAFDRTSGNAVLTGFWVGVEKVTEPINLRVLMLLAGLLLLWRGSKALGGFLVGVALLEQVVGPYAKDLLNRPRPHWGHPIETLSSSSYPAGHATGMACFASVVVLVALSLATSATVRRAVVVAAVVLAALVSVDRLMMGMHYLSDVTGGLVLGLMTTLVCWLVMLLVSRRH